MNKNLQDIMIKKIGKYIIPFPFTGKQNISFKLYDYQNYSLFLISESEKELESFLLPKEYLKDVYKFIIDKMYKIVEKAEIYTSIDCSTLIFPIYVIDVESKKYNSKINIELITNNKETFLEYIDLYKNIVMNLDKTSVAKELENIDQNNPKLKIKTKLNRIK